MVDFEEFYSIFLVQLEKFIALQKLIFQFQGIKKVKPDHSAKQIFEISRMRKFHNLDLESVELLLNSLNLTN